MRGYDFRDGLVVHVTWQIEADNLMLRWEERKGPGIEKTYQRGIWQHTRPPQHRRSTWR
jgi:hypothetical protein